MFNKLKRIIELFRASSESRQRDIPYDWYSNAEVAEYVNALANQNEFETVDAQTYQDLNGRSYARLLLIKRSIFARQYFEQRFRCGAPPEETQEFAEGVNMLSETQPARDALTESVKPLLRVQQEVASLLFGSAGPTLPAVFSRLRFADAIGLVACTLVAAWPSLVSILVLAAYIVFALYIQLRWYGALKEWTSKRDALQRLVETAGAICARKGEIPHGLLVGALLDAACIKRLSGQIRTGALPKIPAASEYANLFFLYEYARAFRESRSVLGNLPVLREIFQSVGRLELQLAIAEAVKSGMPYCRPQRSSGGGIAFDALVHPLLSKPSSLSFDTQGRSLFISGKNGVGKSTLLRAVGLSLATYRAFGYAHASRAMLPRAAVWSSIQVDDSIEQARSLYMSELERAARLLSVAREGKRVVFLVDELFRGTNYVESVSASASALNSLAFANCVFATSHNLVLATLLQRRFDAVRIVGTADRSMRIEQGVIAETNGVELMESYGIDVGLITQAKSISGWYSEYIAHPENVPPGLLH